MSKEQTDLLPCPFCGGTAVLENTAPPHLPRRITAGCSNEQCFAYLPSVWFNRDAEAVEAWNRRASPMTEYSPEIIAQANAYPTLGVEYFAAREAAEKFMAHWREEHAEQFAEAIMKPVMDLVTERVWDAFRDHLLSDTEQNLQSEMQRMVDSSVQALIGGQKWANVKYIESPYQDGQKVRETLAKLHSDPVKDGRIADLEKEVERLTDQLRWARGER